jgi:hypothetical protein
VTSAANSTVIAARKDEFHQRRWTMHGLCILVVEHLPDAADSMSLLLEQWGYKPALVYEGKQALEIAPTFANLAEALWVSYANGS